MREMKPQKRIVSKGRYVVLMGKKIGLCFYGSLAWGIGILGVLWILVVSLQNEFETRWGRFLHTNEQIVSADIVVGLISIFFVWHSKHAFVEANAIEPIQPITDQNAHLLPPQNTLVRASDLPPSEQPSELLRASQAGQETSPEELLRSVAAGE